MAASGWDPADAADRVAAVARSAPGVVGLHPGMFGEVATYLPERRVSGVRMEDDTVDVHITIAFDASVCDTAAFVRSAVANELLGATVNVIVEGVVREQRSVASEP